MAEKHETTPDPVSPSWRVIVSRKKQIQVEAISSFLAHHPAPDHVDAITSIDSIDELVQRVVQGDYSSVDVTKAYCHKAAAAHQETNCLTEILFEDAIQQAQQLDAYYQRHGKPIGPLHGAIMTLKDQFNVKGYDTTLGYVGRAFHPAEEDALLVKTLKGLGAIFIAKTNLPQSIMWCETDNPLWGLTVNPMDHALTPGGSTGGESALLAQHGSLFGWGTDIGGSVRIPSHMLGLYGLKPSSGRLPYDGVPVSTEGQEHVHSVVGPLARSLDSLHTVTKAIIDSKTWQTDPRVHPLPWREHVYQDVRYRPLVIALLVDDGVVKVHPPIARVLEETAAKLQAAGHEIIQWNPDGHKECIEIMVSPSVLSSCISTLSLCATFLT